MSTHLAMPPIPKQRCNHCRLSGDRCDHQKPCANCADYEVSCVYPDSVKENSEVEAPYDLGWTIFYQLQAKILIHSTKNQNLASHLPVIRKQWANLRDEVKELYQLEERGEMPFIQRVRSDSRITTVGLWDLYPRYLLHRGWIVRDESGMEEAKIMWTEEPDDVKQFWKDRAYGLRIARDGVTKLLHVIPPPRPVMKVHRRVQVEYKGEVYELDETDHQFFAALRGMSEEEKIKACLSAQSAERSSKSLSEHVRRLTRVMINGKVYQLDKADHIFFFGACRNLSKEEKIEACFPKNSSLKRRASM